MQSSTVTVEEPVHNKGFIIFLLGILTAFGPLSIDMYLPGLPNMAIDLATDLNHIQLSLSAFFIGLAGGQLIYGPLTDKIGRKKPLYIGLSIYSVTSLICAFSPNVETLIAARFFQALGSCAGMVVTRAIISDLYDHREAARAYSVLVLIMGVAPILAPVLGGQIVVTLGWRYIFYILTVLSILCLIGLAILLPETHIKKSGPKKSVLKTYFSIIKHRNFIQNTIAGGVAQSGMFAYITGSSFVFIELFKVPAEHFGYVFGTNAAGYILFSQVNGRLLKSREPEDILRRIFPVIAVNGVILILAGFFATELWQIWVPIFLMLASLGMTFPNTTACALSEEREHAGSASALMGTLQFTLAASTSSIMSVLHTHSALPMAGIMGGCSIIACCIYFIGKFKVAKQKLA